MDDVCWGYFEFEVVVDDEFLLLVYAESEGFCDLDCAWCFFGGCLVGDVDGEGVCFVVVAFCVFCYFEVFVSACHLVSPSVVCFASFLRSFWSLVLPLAIFDIIHSFGVGCVFVAVTARASAQRRSSWVFGGWLNCSCPFLVYAYCCWLICWIRCRL